MIAAEVTRHSDREFIQSKLMRNVILMILLTDLMAKYDTKATLDMYLSISNRSAEKLSALVTVANNGQEPQPGMAVPRPGSFSPARR